MICSSVAVKFINDGADPGTYLGTYGNKVLLVTGYGFIYLHHDPSLSKVEVITLASANFPCDIVSDTVALSTER